MTLPEDAAWAVATAWQHELRGHVELVIDPMVAHSFDIVKSYEWIHVDLTGRDQAEATRLHRAACLRAACTLWKALASCRGYGGAENPSFWQRVFRALNTREDSGPAPAVEASGFFDRDPGRAFPRVLLSVDDEPVETVERIARVFCGLESYADAEKERLDSMLAGLKGYGADSEVNLSPLPLAVQVPSPLNAMELVEVMASVTAASGSVVSFEELVVNEWKWTEPSASLENLAALRRIARVSIPTLTLSPRGDNTDRYSELQAIFGLAPETAGSSPVAHTSQFLLSRARLDDKEMRAVLSALPHSRQIDTLAFGLPIRTHRDFTDYDWAWLGYAIFHPDTATSSWRRLSLDIEDIGDVKVQNFTRMARGNNLLAALPGDWGSYPRTSDAYHTATLGQDVSVFAKPATEPSRVLTRLRPHSTVDICVASCDVTMFPDFVCAIVPGLGLGWIDKQAITEVTARPPIAAPVLDQFELTSIVASPSLPASLLGVLRLLGPNLQHLGLRPCGYVDSRLLLDLLSCCPKLTSLTVTHEGSLWSDHCIMTAEELAGMPRLSQLELSIASSHPEYLEPSESSLDTILHDLQALRIIPSVKTDGNCRAVGSVLTRHYGLRYFHWQRDTPETATASANATPTALEKILTTLKGGSIDRLTHSLGPLPVRHRAAFLSVIQTAADEPPLGELTATPSALAALDRDILERVFAYASVPHKRQLCFAGQFP